MDTNLHESTLLDQQDISTEAPERQVVKLDETKEYVQPTLNGDFVDVELKRELYAKECNSICLPFNVPADQVVAAWGAGTRVLEFTSTTGNNLNLSDRADIKAGTPYFLQPERVSTDHTYTFTDIETATWDRSGKVPSVTIKPIKLTGFYSPSELPARCYVFGDENKLYHLTSAMPANGFRCYFQDMSGSDHKLTWGIDDNTIIMNNVKQLTIPEGNVTKIEDSEGRVLWSALADPTKHNS